MPDCQYPAPTTTAAWQASLRLRFTDDAGVSRLTERSHRGPLRVQKPLYPEGPGICHAIVVHPPGGVVGGDELAIDAAAGDRTHAFLTSPGAAKWYRANGRVSRQTLLLSAGSGAAIEWMPQESIFYNGAEVELDQQVELALDASYIGCDIVCLGRRASGERFEAGSIGQRLQIRRGGKLVWWEQGRIDARSPLLTSPLGLGGATVCATLIGVGAAVPPALQAAMRALDPMLALSQVKSVFVARLLGHDSETVRRTIVQTWQLLRPHLLGVAAPIPRIWHT